VPRTRQLRVSALNIAFVASDLHNKPDQYRKMFELLASGRHFVGLKNDRHMAIGSARSAAGDKTVIRGVLYGVTSVDAMKWFNTAMHRPASDSELQKIQVPQNMAANYREYDYEFHCDSHRLVFVAREGNVSASPLQMRYVFDQLCQQPEIRAVFGDISVSIEQEPETLTEIFSAENLRWLSILVRRPNAGFGGFDGEVSENMERVRASQAQLELKAESGRGLLPDAETKSAARVALSDGVVRARVREDGVVREISTEDTPIVVVEKYDPKTESRALAVTRAVEKILAKIKSLAANE